MGTVTFRKIARFMDIDDTTTIKNIFGKNKFKQINKASKTIENNHDVYTTGVQEMTINNLHEFYTLYEKEIIKKHNAKIYNLIEIYEPQILSGKNIYFSFVRENNILIAGGISSLKTLRGKKTLVGCVKIGNDTSLPGIVYYIEYLFFSLGLDLHVQQFSAGKDRNCYGSLGENIGLAIHKLQNHYLPYKSSDKQEFEIEEKDIKTETLLFIPNENNNNLCDKAILRSNKTQDQIDEEFVLLKKRGILLDIRPLSIK